MANDYADLITLQNKVKQVLSLPSSPVSGNDGYIKITWSDATGEDWEVYAKITQDLQFTRNSGNQLVSNFFIGLKAKDPYIFSQNTNTATQLKGWVGDGTLGTPLFTDTALLNKYFNILDIYSSSSISTPPTFRINGYSENPKIYKISQTVSSRETVSNFATGWTGGTSDIIHFIGAFESRKLTSTGSVADTMVVTGSYDLTDYDYVTMYMYIEDVTKVKFGNYLGAENYIKFKTNKGTDEFVRELFHGINDDNAILNTLGSTSGWNARNDASNITLDTTEYKEGMGCLNFDLTVSANRASIYNSALTPLDLYKYEENGIFRVWVYLPSVTNLTNVTLYVGDDTSNRWYSAVTTDINGDALAVGWNFLKFDWNTATQVGTPDATSVNYVEVELNYTGGYGNQTDVRIDAIEFVPKQSYKVLGNTLVDGWNVFRVSKNKFKSNIC